MLSYDKSFVKPTHKKGSHKGMVTDRFGVLLEELGTAMNLKLSPDKFSSCVIRLPSKLDVAIKTSPSGEDILILIELGAPGSGPFRANILKEALMANAQTEARKGIFCYGEKKDQLLLYKSIPIYDLTGQQLFDILSDLSETARYWKECLSRGELPQRYAPRSGQNIFGLR
jgi:hypothetical protein